METFDSKVSSHDWPRGARASERYRLRRHLGAGGMGMVYLARDQVLGRDVVLKFLIAELSDRNRERFRREAKLMAKLRSSTFVEVFELELEGDIPWIAMEYLEGKDFHRAPPEDPLAAYLEIAQGLEVLHQAGVLHRDVKPENCFRTQAGRILLIDFGLARASQDPRLTKSGFMVGTPGFWAPELLEDEPPTPATDFYAWGVSLYETLEGKAPFEALQVPGVPRGPLVFSRVGPDQPVAGLIRACLAEDPRRRPTDRGAIDRILSMDPGEGTIPQDPGARSKSPASWARAAPRTRQGMQTLALGSLLLLAGVLAWFWPGPKPPNPGSPGAKPSKPLKTLGPKPQEAWLETFLREPPQLDPATIRDLRRRGEEPWAKPFLSWLAQGGELFELRYPLRKKLGLLNQILAETMPDLPFSAPWTLDPLRTGSDPDLVFAARKPALLRTIQALEDRAAHDPRVVPGAESQIRLGVTSRHLFRKLLETTLDSGKAEALHRFLGPCRDATTTVLHFGLVGFERAPAKEQKARFSDLRELASQGLECLFGFPSEVPLEQLFAWSPKTPAGRSLRLRLESQLGSIAKLSGRRRRLQPRTLAREAEALVKDPGTPEWVARESWFLALETTRQDGAFSHFESLIETYRPRFERTWVDFEKTWVEGEIHRVGLEKSRQGGRTAP